jgi:hypothetical protein
MRSRISFGVFVLARNPACARRCSPDRESPSIWMGSSMNVRDGVGFRCKKGSEVYLPPFVP